MTSNTHENAAAPPSGITHIARGNMVLRAASDQPALGTVMYALGFPLQVGPRTAGLLAMRMIEGAGNYGFLDGSDVILFDELKPPLPAKIFPGSRNEITPGRDGAPPSLLMKSPMIGGFVPRGALMADGSPHPHAGTGFAISQAQRLSFPDGRFSWGDPQRRDMIAVYQLQYDGETFATRQTQLWDQNGTKPFVISDTGWTIAGDVMHGAIPANDGEDLLMATTAARADPPAIGIGIVRWARRDGEWRPVDFDPVDFQDGAIPAGPNPKERCLWMEPSLTRDADGSLLIAARGADTFDATGDGTGYLLRVWRSRERRRWSVVIDQRQARLNSPVTINTAADGSAYLVSSPYDRAFIPETATTGRGRERVVIWPLNAPRDGLTPPLLIRDCLAEFGRPPAGDKPEFWMADHANGATVRLRDGKWHHIMAYRICHCPRYLASAVVPSVYSGCYVEEVMSGGPEIPVWRFADED